MSGPVTLDPRDAMTERLLVDAGLRTGMRVLDAGCGSGTVCLILARIVGTKGAVVGLDKASSALGRPIGRALTDEQ